ncbi:PREDICTED: metastasis-suppressor KiSS-1 [Condylura cristata]|uniref:metastasis-suppressor KiSS-1 n=1 Tax=Condylura cristata TaxID=143302 RepID=UPI0003347AF3|nr:PREDICTED: metastasis-suppressor KiSS-1 [Condylura cristata]
MNSRVYWQLILFLCATSFGETSEKLALGENPRCSGLLPQRRAIPGSWEQSPRREEGRVARTGLSPRGASLCPPPEHPASPQHPGVCPPGSRQIPAPRSKALVQREKDLPTYNWNSFGLRYGKRQAAAPEAKTGPGGQGCQALSSKPRKRAPSLWG